ncbi:MAG: phosphodiester glycosidase family protein [Actinomycetota bacterium]
MPRRSRPRGPAAITLALSLLLSFPLTTIPSAASINTVTVAPGLTWTRMVKTSPRRNVIHYLTVDPAEAVTLDVALARDRLLGFQRTSVMANNHEALAAVNGDFGLSPGRPQHAFAEDGDLKQLTVAGGNKNFAMSDDELTANVGRPPDMAVTATATSSSETREIAEWNTGDPTAGTITGYTRPAHGVEQPRPGACSLQLMPSGPKAFSPSGAVQRPYEVSTEACSSYSEVPTGVVLSANQGSAEALWLSEYSIGDEIVLEWSFGWGGILDAIGGSPVLVEEGALVAPTSCWTAAFCRRHPRTGVGVTAEGDILLVTVDGRRRNSAGMTLTAFGKLFLSLGAEAALNLDGGGSTTMVVNGNVVNRPSDGKQRAVSSALIVLPGPDGDETLAPEQAVAAPSGSWDLALHDPASTGGLLDAQRRGVIEGPIGPRMAGLVREFRESRGQDLNL